MKHAKGFTLIELMITVAILVVLVSIAIPNYLNYTVKGNRTAATWIMLEVENREKQYMLDARTYADLPTLGITSLPPDVAKFYTVIATPSATPPGYTITATPIPGTRQADDGELKLDSTGLKTPADKW